MKRQEGSGYTVHVQQHWVVVSIEVIKADVQGGMALQSMEGCECDLLFIDRVMTVL